MSQSDPTKSAIIFSTRDTSGKIYIREQQGYFQRVRRSLGVLLMAIFVLLPFIPYQGSQAFLIDASALQVRFFALQLFPQDLLIVALIFIFAAFALFYLTKLYGRIWCGYTCPQTIWTLIFVWIERRIEGSHQHSRALDRAGLCWQKIWKKTAKHLSWFAVSLLTALVFISYFVPATELYPAFFQGQTSAAVLCWVLFFAVCTYLNAGLVREKMCLHMCPYARFQSAMFDGHTRQVSYDSARGEQRGPRKRSSAKPAGLGDCVDCNLCVQVCPVGIDIRHGLQYECINCGLCIDACDDTMQQFGYAKGLIRYSAEHEALSLQSAPEQRGSWHWRRHLGYGLALMLTLLAMLSWYQLRQHTELLVSRERSQLYRMNEQGELENTFTLNLINKSRQTQHYQLAVLGLDGVTLHNVPPLVVESGEQRQFVLQLSVDQAPARQLTKFQFVLQSQQEAEVIVGEASFYRGNAAY
jgi:cytochrome c oxidase accessory protein FixG